VDTGHRLVRRSRRVGARRQLEDVRDGRRGDAVDDVVVLVARLALALQVPELLAEVGQERGAHLV